jgi:hypothetical protein
MHARRLEKMPDAEFFQKYGELTRIYDHVGLATSRAAEKLYELHYRHGKQVGTVLTSQIEVHADAIRKHEISPKSLLAIAVGQDRARVKAHPPTATFPTPEGANWKDILIEITSHESLRISCRGIKKTYTAFDIGYRDGRRGDRLTKQWDLLVGFAQTNGVLNWSSNRAREGIQKSVQSLRQNLKSVFNMTDSPIHNYTKKNGYVTKFQIRDISTPHW